MRASGRQNADIHITINSYEQIMSPINAMTLIMSSNHSGLLLSELFKSVFLYCIFLFYYMC